MLHCNLERIFHFCPFFRLNRKAVCSIHFNGRVRGKLTDVCNDASGIRNERPKFLAMMHNLYLNAVQDLKAVDVIYGLLNGQCH